MRQPFLLSLRRRAGGFTRASQRYVYAALCALGLLLPDSAPGEFRPDARAVPARGRGAPPVPTAAEIARARGAPIPDDPHAVADEILVRFRPARAEPAMAQLAATAGIRVLHSRRFNFGRWQRIRVNSDKPLKQAIEACRQHPDVLYAEPNYIVEAYLTPDDPRFDQLWGLRNTGQTGGVPGADINAIEAWDIATTSHVVVAVIDSGVDYNHPDLAANIWANPAEIAGNGLDDDGNGYVDDVRGWDFYDSDNDPMDVGGHGTHVAGTIGAVGNNAEGVVGVCWQVRIMPLKFIGTFSGSTADAIEAIEYATAMGAQVMNNSWGGGGYSVAMKEAIEAAHAAGLLFVAAAGNSSEDTDTIAHYPSSYDVSNIIAVAATTDADLLASFSSYGATTVDLGAPGKNIWSTIPSHQYGQKSGTSMATPHVAGACALLWGVAGPGMSHMEVRQALLDGTEPLPALAGKCVTGGRLDLMQAVGSVMTSRVVRLRYPAGGEGLEQGATVGVEWGAFGQLWTNGDAVHLEYSADAGSNWQDVAGATNVPYDSGTYAWETDALPLGTQYLVRASSAADTNVTDTSDSTFAVAGPLAAFAFTMAPTQANGYAVYGECTIEPLDTNGVLITSFDSYVPTGRFPIAVQAPGVTVGGLGGSGDELAPSNFVNGVADLTGLGMTVSVAATPTTAVFSAVSQDAMSGASGEVTLFQPPDYFTQFFDAESFDLTNSSLLFLPSDSPDFYTAYRRAISELPTDPTNGTPLDLPDDGWAVVPLTNGAVALYGLSRSNVFVGSNGYITFDEGDMSYMPGLDSHFELPRIAALFADFWPEPGDVSWKELADRLVVTYQGAPEYRIENSSTFQAELYHDGTIVLSFLGIDAGEGVVGLSAGDDTPADYFESDLSACPLLPARLLRLIAPNGGERAVTNAPVAVSWRGYGDGWEATDTVWLDYSDDGGAAWTPVPGGTNLDWDAAGFDWDTAGLGTGHAYRVRVSFAGDTNVFDASDAGFSIIEDRTLAITAPLPGDLFDLDATVQVTWTPAGSAWGPADTVRLDYSDDAGVTWQTITGAESLAYDLSAFDWDTTGLARGDGYSLRVVWVADPMIDGTLGATFVLRAAYYVNDGNTDNDQWCTQPGADTNAGTSADSPKASLQALLDTCDLEPGDVVRVDTGVYDLDGTVVVGSNDAGHAVAPMTIEGSPGGVTLNNTNGNTVLLVQDADYVTVRTALDVESPVGNLLMRVSGGDNGVELQTAEHGALESLELAANDAAGVHAEESHYLSVRGCIIRENLDSGICLDYADRAVLDGNVICSNASYGIDLLVADYTAISNNVICENEFYGVSLFSDYNVLGNNTLAWNTYCQIDVSGAATIYNNILCARDTDVLMEVYWDEGLDSDYNLFHTTDGATMGWYISDDYATLAQWQAVAGQDAHSIEADPSFVGEDDYHLQSTAGSYHGGSWQADASNSPAIDAGFGDAACEPAPNATAWAPDNLLRRNQGAYGGTAQASKTPAGSAIRLSKPRTGYSHPDPSVPLTIDWAWQGTDWASNATVRLDYSLSTGETWTAVAEATNLALSAASYEWAVTGLTAGLFYQVRIMANHDTNITDQTTATVRIGGPFLWYVNDASVSNDLWCTAPGSDANHGLSIEYPKASVQAVLDAFDLEPGDTVRIDTGEYALSNAVSQEAWHRGASNAPVTFEASPYGVVLDRGDPTGSYSRVWENWGAAYTELRTVGITNVPAPGQAPMQIVRGSDGLFLYADNCTVEYVDVASNGTYGVKTDGIGIALRHLNVRESGSCGLYLYRFDAGLLEDCVVADNALFGVQVRYTDYAALRNCLVRDTTGKGIQLYYSDFTVLSNNTVAANTDDQLWVEYRCRGVTLRNNIFCSGNAGAYALYWGPTDEMPDSDYNLFLATNTAPMAYLATQTVSFAEWQGLTGQDAHSLERDPLFVDTNAADYHLQSTAGSYHAGAWSADATNSPGIDTGEPGAGYALETDWNGGRVNMGAYGNTVQASRSADTDADSLSDTLERFVFGSDPDNPDTDDDTVSDWGEFIAGTDPTNPASLFEIAEADWGAASNFVVSWSSVTNKSYTLERTTNSAPTGFSVLGSNILATPPLNTYTDDITGVERAFYRIETQR
ncbi:MAG: S8 family serine peptidase [Kiritimatiellae bacterium]|nr:S8 family serine peptidase [Kiritimatiellia bacterium]